MKKLILPIMFILLVQIVFAIFGGESKVIYSFEKCLNLTINVNASLPIDEGEFSFLNCTNISQSYWFCNCSNNFNLVLTTKPNTINDYTFLFNYEYFKEEVKTVSSGTSNGYSSSWICGNWSECLNNRTERICFKSKTINYTQFKSCISKVKEPIKKEIVEIEVAEEINLIEKIDTKEDIVCTTCGGGAVDDTARKDFIKRMISVIVVLSVIIIGLSGYFIYRKRKKDC